MSDLLALLASDPTAGILAAADLREQRTKAVRPGLWHAGEEVGHDVRDVVRDGKNVVICETVNYGIYDGVRHAEHIAAEANPVHALATVRVWRLVVEYVECKYIRTDGPLMLGTVAAVRAYLGDASTRRSSGGSPED